MMRLGRVELASAMAVWVAATSAIAAPPQALSPEFIRGRVESISTSSVRVKTSAGKIETISLAPDWNVQVTKPISVDQIKSGSFIGTAEMPQKDGTGRSLEVHVFPPGVKIGEGHYGWSLKKGSMMTNGTVGKVVASGGGRAFDVSYPTGKRHIVVPPGTPIVQIVGGGREAVRPGVRVFVPAVRTPAGLATNSIAVGADGTAPPM